MRRDLIGIGLFIFLLTPMITRPDPAIAETTKRVSIELHIELSKRILVVYVNHTPYKTYPVALGKPETPTPIGNWLITNKSKDWGGGFGTRWLGLNVPWGIYGIHGTNRPSSIGNYASNGCIRMHNHDIEELYNFVHVGVPVFIPGNPLAHPRNLAVGDIGADVQLVQLRLLHFGFYHGTCNGRFEQTTEQALKAFEKAHGLPVDGIVGRKDYQLLGLIES
ncbi:hypothetical protein BM613_03660 [Sulfoacidibacillus thermotolerans]|uniref:L,D-TPase catalytic domain-containing protein n=2 Tax=Sulfoacidibacillus thermotolerans TaxID=1765684 RepID=A0A2U3DAW6_SULT2|nr:hypothetical protein BM613_03660 [Sulfoacidibacillus thermotolerans]